MTNEDHTALQPDAERFAPTMFNAGTAGGATPIAGNAAEREKLFVTFRTKRGIQHGTEFLARPSRLPALKGKAIWAAVLPLCLSTIGAFRPVPSLPSQSTAVRSTDHTAATGALCNADKSLCVSGPASNDLITNPFDIAGTAATGIGDVSWELDDQSGQRLASGKASDDPRWSASNETASRFHMRNYVFVLPKSAAGILTLWPERNDQKGASSERAKLAVPVRFGSARSTLRVSVPKNYEQYRAEAGDWDSANGSPFNPASPFIEESLTVMRVDDAVFASAEAAAENASVLSQVPVRILNFAVQGGSAYVDVNLNDLEDHWAGISLTIAEVETLIEKDLSQFPGIHKIIFGWPPLKADSLTSPAEKDAQSRASSYRACGDAEYLRIQDDPLARGSGDNSEART